MAKHRATRRRGLGASAGALGSLAAVLATVLVVALVVVFAVGEDEGALDAGTTLRPATSASGAPGGSSPAELTQSASAAASVAPGPTSKTSAQPSKKPPGRPAASPRPGDRQTLELVVTGAATYLKVSVPGGRVLFDDIAGKGRELSFDQPRLAVVLGSSGDVRVTVNGKVRPKGRRGIIDRFTVVRR